MLEILDTPLAMIRFPRFRNAIEKYYFDDGKAVKDIKTINDIAKRVLKDEWTIFINWKSIFDLISPSFTLHNLNKQPSECEIYINSTKIKYKKVASCAFKMREEECTICCEEFTKYDRIKELPCQHVFHEKCIKSWLFRDKSLAKKSRHGDSSFSKKINKFTCPCCRANLFDWFFFNQYKPFFISHCEKSISVKDKHDIERKWKQKVAERVH